MLERLVENWLASSGERGYEVAFAQLLAAEGHKVIQGPVHHPFEHGKDIFTFAPDGRLHAYQLKGPDLTNLEGFEKIAGQLLALVASAITHPAVSPPRRPDRAFLVSNAVFTPPVRDRIEKFNLGNASLGYGAVEPIEREQLVSRFLAAHGKYLPQQLDDIRTLIELYYDDGKSLFPVRRFAAYIEGLLPFPPENPSGPELRRAMASVALVTAYALSSWTKTENHLCVAQGWLVACITLVRFASVRGISEDVWRPTYDLALEVARASLASLSKEAAEAQDLVVPDLVESLVYASRAVLVCGHLAAYFISERTLGLVDDDARNRIRGVLKREHSFVKLSGESEIPGFVMMSAALGQLGEIRNGEAMALSLVRTLATFNQRESPSALPDPYHSAEDVLLSRLGGDSDLEGEQFDGHSYMLMLGVQWVARRLCRQFLASVWADVTRIELVEMQPSNPNAYLAEDDPDGELKISFAGQPQSWAELLAESRRLDRSKLPDLLWARRELIPYLPLLFPYRFTPALAAAIDLISSDPAA